MGSQADTASRVEVLVTSTCFDRRELARLLGPFYRQGVLYIPCPYALTGVVGTFNLRLVLGDESDENTVLKAKARRVDPEAHGLATSGYPGFALSLSELDPRGRQLVAEFARHAQAPRSVAGAAHGQDPILCHFEFKNLSEPAPAPDVAVALDEEPDDSTVIVGDDFSFMGDEEEDQAPAFGDDYEEERTAVTGGIDMENFLNMSESEEAPEPIASSDLPALPQQTGQAAPRAVPPMRVPTVPPIPAPASTPFSAPHTPVPTPAPPTPPPGPAPMMPMATPAPMTPMATPAPMMPMATPAPMAGYPGMPVPTPYPDNQGNNPNYQANNPNYQANNPNYQANNPNYNAMPSSIFFGDQPNHPNTGTAFVNAGRRKNRKVIIAASIAVIALALVAGYFLWASKDGATVAANASADASSIGLDSGHPTETTDAAPIESVADASVDVPVEPDFDAALASACQVSITTEPEGAALFYMGTNLGITPYNGPIDCEAKVVDIRHPQYESAQAKFQIVDGVGSADLVQLKRPSFWVTINSVPDDATLKIDDEFIGKTPFSLPLPGFEWTSITISHKGYASEIIDILPTEPKSAINLKLQRE